MKRRTKLEMSMMKNECTSYLLNTNFDYLKAFELMVKENLENNTSIPYYIKDIKDFKNTAEELIIQFNIESKMKKNKLEKLEEENNIKKLICDYDFAKLKKFYNENKINFNKEDKLNFIDLIILKSSDDFNEKLVSIIFINIFKKYKLI